MYLVFTIISIFWHFIDFIKYFHFYLRKVVILYFHKVSKRKNTKAEYFK